MTNNMQELISSIFEKQAEKNLSVSKVFGEVYKAMKENAELAGGVYQYFFKDAESKKDLFARFLYAMPHVVYAGTDKIVCVDFVEADPIKEYTQAFVEARCDVEDEVHTYAAAVNMAQAEREVNRTEKVVLESGWEMEVPSKDAEGKSIKVKKLVNLVPREKTQWGYTSVVKRALLKAIIAWEIENGLA